MIDARTTHANNKGSAFPRIAVNKGRLFLEVIAGCREMGIDDPVSLDQQKHRGFVVGELAADTVLGVVVDQVFKIVAELVGTDVSIIQNSE